jgi:tetratricopeptide (TPR) repeat protein
MKQLVILLLFAVFTANGLAQSEYDAIVANANRIFYEGKFTDAVVEISKIVVLEPNKSRSYLIRARFQKAAKDEANFYRDLDKAIEFGGNDLSVVTSVSRYLIQTGKKSDCEKIEKLISPHITENSQNAESLSIRFQAKSCYGDLVGAFNDISKASALDPSNSTYPLMIANLLSRLGDSNQALDVYGSQIKDLENKLGKVEDTWERDDLKVRIASLYKARSSIHEKNGNKSLMIADLTKAVDIIENPATIQARSAAYVRLQMYAIADLTREIKIRSDNFAKDDSPPATPLPPLIRKTTIEHISRLFSQRGDLYFLTDKFSEAIADYEQAIKLDPSAKERLALKIANAKQNR